MRYGLKLMIISGTAGVILAITLLVNHLLTNPIRAGQIRLRSPVNVAATAQAIQSNSRQMELKSTLQAQKAGWEAEIAKKQQAIAEANLAAQTQQTQLEDQLFDLQIQLEQLATDVEAGQAEASQLQQAIQDDESSHQQKLAQFEAELAQLQDALDAAKAELQLAAESLSTQQPDPGAMPVDAVNVTNLIDPPADHDDDHENNDENNDQSSDEDKDENSDDSSHDDGEDDEDDDSDSSEDNEHNKDHENDDDDIDDEDHKNDND